MNQKVRFNTLKEGDVFKHGKHMALITGIIRTGAIPGIYYQHWTKCPCSLPAGSKGFGSTHSVPLTNRQMVEHVGFEETDTTTARHLETIGVVHTDS